MKCRKCGYESLDARLGGLCASFERKERDDRNHEDGCVIAAVLFIIAVSVVCSVVWAIVKFAAVVKWIMM